MALYLLYRGIRDRRYFAGLPERLGFLPALIQPTGASTIWFHAVSVGEILSCVELIRAIRATHPRTRMYVSTATLAGRDTADLKLDGIADGVFFAPLDYRSTVRRVLRRLRPAAVVVLETEIWPNLYRESKRAGASLIVVNARISDSALPRYRRWRWFFCHVLRSADAIFAQSEEDKRRFIEAGARADQVQVAGNLKYDFKPPSTGITPDILQFLDRTKPAKVWIAASTMPPADSADVDEDDEVIKAFARVAEAHPGLLLILAPRRPERFDAVAEKLKRAGVNFVRRTKLTALTLPGVLLVDSIGELAALFERADVVFMGGTIARRGGHNILEPAYFAKPVIVGPHMENFAAIAQEFHAGGALERIEGSLDASVIKLLDDPGTLGARAHDLAMSKRGVVDRIAREVLTACSNGVPDPHRTLLARIALTPLSWIWAAGHRVNVARHLARRRSLSTPVISVGGLTMGGSGKSPMVAHLARLLREQGRDPAILTRGYHRKSHDRLVIVPRGETASTALTGDEAQTYIRAGDAHIGVGADRYAAGVRMEQTLSPDIFILDDGFQHRRLARTRDIVMIDALDPFGGGLFPLGRRREPCSSLRRASAIVVTRVESGQEIAGLRRMLGEYTSAPVYTAHTAPRAWIGYPSNAETKVEGPVAAFCGLGNPRAFWTTLEDLGIDVVFRWAFRDHHHYRPTELERLARQAAECGAATLVTTEKDIMNLCDHAAEIVAPHSLLWLKVGIEIDREQEFLRQIL